MGPCRRDKPEAADIRQFRAAARRLPAPRRAV